MSNNTNNKITFYIHELEYAISFLFKLKLVDYSSRMRTRMLKILSERHHQYKEEYLELVKEHSNLDDDGNPIRIKEEDGRERYDIIDSIAFSKALNPLLDEEFIIDITDNNKNMIKSVAKSVLNCGIEFEGNDQFNYDDLAMKFDDLEFGGDE